MREKETHMAKKYYVVWRGKQTGVFSTWKQCKQQVHGFPDAKYKSFTSKEEAKLAYEKGPDTTKKQTGYIGDSISVDAACSGNPGVMEYQGVHTRTGKQIFHYGPVPKGTDNIGEFLAIVDRKSTRLNSSHVAISYAVFCLKKNKNESVT